MMISELFFRVFHWGPMTALIIIKCITFTTLYLTSFWLPPSHGLLGLINHLVYLALIAFTLYNFFCATFIGPGLVCLKWRPQDSSDCIYLQYCSICQGFKPPRAHHCRKCGRCVMKMDHHCPWINNCCGYRNQANFSYFLLSAVLGAIHSSVLLINALYRGYFLNWYYHNQPQEHHRLVYLSLTTLLSAVFSIGLSIGVIIAVGGLLYIQIKIMVTNQTSIEEWIVTKATSRKRTGEFIYPYNLGCWKNIKQVLCDPTNNGLTWPVVEGCDQYTLTVEQLIQKEEKRSRACQYKVITIYNGRWFPLFSQGCRVCISLPISDEPRIALSLDDIVLVTRWKKHWLYGEICASKGKNVTNNGNERMRGWFPRRCVVEMMIVGGNNGGYSDNRMTPSAHVNHSNEEDYHHNQNHGDATGHSKKLN